MSIKQAIPKMPPLPDSCAKASAAACRQEYLRIPGFGAGYGVFGHSNETYKNQQIHT
ncbi:MAG: hypothetical protein RIA62_07580 [Cyclobacteriaceae bacterium]